MRLAEGERVNGRYVYRLNGLATAIREEFQAVSFAPGMVEVQGLRQGGTEDAKLEVSGRLTEGHLLDARFGLRHGSQHNYRHYRVASNGWQIDGESTDDVPRTALLFGLLRVFTGPLLFAIEARGGVAEILTPGLQEHAWLEPQVSQRRVEVADERDTNWSAQVGAMAEGHPTTAQVNRMRHLRYLGGPYELCHCELDGRGLLSRYDWHQAGVGDWQVSLQLD